MSPRGARDAWFSVSDRRKSVPWAELGCGAWVHSVQMLLLTWPWFLGEHPQLWLPVFPVILLSFSSQKQLPGISGEVSPQTSFNLFFPTLISTLTHPLMDHSCPVSPLPRYGWLEQFVAKKK